MEYKPETKWYSPASTEVIISKSSIQELTDASLTGYARSKLVADRMLEKAVTVAGARATFCELGR
jgi:hypothetical protein